MFIVLIHFRDIIKSHNDDLNEENHIFLKRVCNILSSLGQLQLANIWVCHVTALAAAMLPFVLICNIHVLMTKITKREPIFIYFRVLLIMLT